MFTDDDNGRLDTPNGTATLILGGENVPNLLLKT